MDDKIRYVVKLSLHKDKKFFGPGIAELLCLVDKKGSLRMAAMEMNMAYSKAWKIFKAATDALGFPLLDSQTGGKNGGGAQLTPEGRAFLEKYTKMDKELQQQAKTLFEKHFTNIDFTHFKNF